MFTSDNTPELLTGFSSTNRNTVLTSENTSEWLTGFSFTNWIQHQTEANGKFQAIKSKVNIETAIS